MNENKRITISQSPGLARMRLSELAGRSAVIVEDLTDKDRRDKGYMVQLDRPFLGESLWYIPVESVNYE